MKKSVGTFCFLLLYSFILYILQKSKKLKKILENLLTDRNTVRAFSKKKFPNNFVKILVEIFLSLKIAFY